MKKLLLFICIYCVTYQVMGQNGNTEMVTFSDGTTMELGNFLSDNYHYPALSLSVGAMGGARPLTQFDLLLALQASYMHNKIGYFTSRWDLPVAKILDNQYEFLYNPGFSDMKTLNEVKVHRSFEVGLGVFLLDKDVSHMRKIPVKSTGTVDYVANLKIPTRYIIALRGGLFSYRSIVSNYILPEMISEDGTVLYNGGIMPINDPELTQTYLTNFTSRAFYYGIDLRRLTNLSFEVDGYESGLTNKISLYYDMFVAGKMTMDEMMVPDSASGVVTNYVVLHDKPGGFIARNTGFRVGLEIQGYLSDHSAITFQFEGGVRPGIDNALNDASPFSKYFYMGRMTYTFGTSFD